MKARATTISTKARASGVRPKPHADTAKGGAGRSGGATRPSLERLRQLKELIQGGRYPNCRTMAEKLEVSPKTVQRDIDFLRDTWGLPIEYDQAKFGFTFTAEVTDFPKLEISEGEVVALFIAQKALQEQGGTVFERPLRAACDKIASSLEGRITLDWTELEAISFRHSGQSRADLAVFEQVSRAVRQQAEIAFHYQKLRSAQLEVRRARPYHLGCVEHQWYCFAHDLDRGQMRTFALSRMGKVQLTGTSFVRPAEWSLRKHLGESFGVFRSAEGARVQRVRIRFDKWASRLVRERVWHESQKVRPLSDGRVELELELGGLEEIERWVLSWGEHAEVLGPKKLRERVCEVARQILARV